MNHPAAASAGQYSFPSPMVSSMSHSAPVTYTRPSARVTNSSTTEFRGSTNPDEDWTKISDLAERRRIQNRIAQRNYRKKLKRRLEDLERRAASRSISPNGEDTDGRSTRESSAEQPLASPPPPPPHTLPEVPLQRENYLPPLSSAAYTTAAATNATTTNTTAASYPPQYRSAASSNSGPFSSSSSPTPYYPSAAAAPASDASHYDPPSTQYMYAYSQPTLSSMVEATCGSNMTASAAPEHNYLPLPSTRISSNNFHHTFSDFITPKTSSGYDENSMNPFYLSYTSLAESPDPSYFSTHYYPDEHNHSSPSSTSSTHSSPMALKHE